MFRQPFHFLLRRAREAVTAGRYREAEELIWRILTRAPEHRAGRLLRGELLVRRGCLPEALLEYRQLLGEDPQDVDARLHLAGTLLATGEYTEGIDHIHHIAQQAVEEWQGDEAQDVSATASEPDSRRLRRVPPSIPGKR